MSVTNMSVANTWRRYVLSSVLALAATGAQAELAPGFYRYTVDGRYGNGDFSEIAFVPVFADQRYCMDLRTRELGERERKVFLHHGKWQRKQGQIVLDNGTIISEKPLANPPAMTFGADEDALLPYAEGREHPVYINGRRAEYEPFTAYLLSEVQDLCQKLEEAAKKHQNPKK